ncbi:MAG: hypothetical protein LBB79_04865, partial [Prevotellaceae bacterium]|nr:hypothetical protein [Prevotellaceae bacterium]
ILSLLPSKPPYSPKAPLVAPISFPDTFALISLLNFRKGISANCDYLLEVICGNVLTHTVGLFSSEVTTFTCG